MINYNDVKPAALNGGNNVHWQTDTSGNISAYVALRKIIASPVAGVVTLDASQADSFYVNVSAAINSMVISNPSDGQEITILWAQDASGHAVTLPTNLLMGTLTVSTTASKHTTAKFTYNAPDNNWYILGQNGL